MPKYDAILVDRRRQWRKRAFTQNPYCDSCGVRMTLNKVSGHLPIRATVDHIIPLSKGGKDTPENYQLLCYKCNIDKGNA